MADGVTVHEEENPKTQSFESSFQHAFWLACAFFTSGLGDATPVDCEKRRENRGRTKPTLVIMPASEWLLH
jgi:hypothetical protein